MTPQPFDLFRPAPPPREAKFPDLREFQARAHQQLREGVRQGRRKQLLVAPTGSGKTVIGLNVIRETLGKSRRAIFVCDRTALINQTSARADEYGLTEHAIVQASHWRRNNALPFQIASIQTIQARGYWPEADVVVIDEAHTVYSAVQEFLATTSAVVVGLTATPCTAGLAKLYDRVVNAATMDELTKLGILVPMNILNCVSPDMQGAATAGGEWTAKAASERELKIVGNVLAEWQKHASDRKTIAFGPDIAYCTELAQQFNAAGIGAATYTTETGDSEREALLREFLKPNPDIRVLISVEALAKGFDVQDIGCVIDARPLRKSLSTAIQMWGRGLRSSPATGKQDCILLSFSGNIARFYDDFVDIYFNGFGALDSAEKMDGSARREPAEDFTPAGCPQCQHKPFRRRCLACGFEKPTQALVESTPGEMQEVRIGKKVLAADKLDLWNQLCTYAKLHLKTDKKAGWAYFKYHDLTGEKPPRSFDFDRAPIVTVNPATTDKLRSMQIAYARGRSRAVA